MVVSRHVVAAVYEPDRIHVLKTSAESAVDRSWRQRFGDDYDAIVRRVSLDAAYPPDLDAAVSDRRLPADDTDRA